MAKNKLRLLIYLMVVYSTVYSIIFAPTKASCMHAQAIIFAAGRSTRFNTEKTKVSFSLCGKEIILWVLDAFTQCIIKPAVIVGHQKEMVIDVLQKKSRDAVTIIEQQEQRGTGHAFLCSQPAWLAEHLIVTNGDMPLITSDLMNELYKYHTDTAADLTFVKTHYDLPGHTYGRIVHANNMIRIVEAKHFDHTMQHEGFINAGVYIIKKRVAEHLIKFLQPHPQTNQIYITDLVELAQKFNYRVEMFTVNYDSVRGVNTLQELWEAEHIKRSALIKYWMHRGVRFTFPHTVHIDHDVTIGSDTVIEAGVSLKNGTKIGTHCTIHAFAQMANSSLADNVTVFSHSVITDATIHKHAKIGPFAHIRNSTVIHENAVIGNFVETTKSTVGPHSKAKHLSYLGNATLGSHVNVGAGTITGNYNGFIKQETVIGDRVQIGCNNSLIAPLIIEKGAITAAGSCITEKVPENALALARARQVTKEGYAEVLREKCQQAKRTYSPATISEPAEPVTE